MTVFCYFVLLNFSLEISCNTSITQHHACNLLLNVILSMERLTFILEIDLYFSLGIRELIQHLFAFIFFFFFFFIIFFSNFRS